MNKKKFIEEAIEWVKLRLSTCFSFHRIPKSESSSLCSLLEARGLLFPAPNASLSTQRVFFLFARRYFYEDERFFRGVTCVIASLGNPFTSRLENSRGTREIVAFFEGKKPLSCVKFFFSWLKSIVSLRNSLNIYSFPITSDLI